MARPPIPRLDTLFAPAAADREANAAGSLGAGQRARLRTRRGLLCIALGVAIVIGAYLFRQLAVRGFFANPGGIALGAALGLLWLAWMGWALMRVWQATADLRAGKVAAAEGQVQHDFRLTPGIIRIVRHQIRLGDLVFPMPKSAMVRFSNQESYRLYYAPRSRVLVAAVRVAPQRAGATTADAAPIQPAAAPSQSGAAGHSPRHRDEPAGQPAPLIEPLSGRELEILRLIEAGMSNQEIANHLHLSVNTIKMYASQLYAKLGVNRRTEALARARELGLL